jgi:hypothetical protein
MPTAFISGPISPPADYFSTHYAPLLLSAAARGDSFVLGPAAGIDTVARSFLLSSAAVPAARITVYLAGFEAKAFRASRFAAFEAAGGNVRVAGVTTAERDAAMTAASDYDILRYMSPEEARAHYGEAYWPRVSNTEKNERRRTGLPLHGNAASEVVLAAAAERAKGRRPRWMSRVRQRFGGS